MTNRRTPRAAKDEPVPVPSAPDTADTADRADTADMPVRRTQRKSAVPAAIVAETDAPGEAPADVAVRPPAGARRRPAAPKPAEPVPPAVLAENPEGTSIGRSDENGNPDSPVRPSLVLHPGASHSDDGWAELNGEVEDILPTLLAGERDRWERLTEECSSALALMGGPARVGVTSCVRGEGRSTIAIAMALAQRHRFGTTILLESDVEEPSLAGILGLQQGPGVAEVLRGEAALADCIQWTGTRLGVVTAGNVGPEPSWLSPRMLSRDLVGELGELCDGLVVDLPPFLGSGVGVARSCPNVVLVIRAGATPMDRVERVAAELGHPPAILNRAEETLPRWMRRLFRARK